MNEQNKKPMTNREIYEGVSAQIKKILKNAKHEGSEQLEEVSRIPEDANPRPGDPNPPSTEQERQRQRAAAAEHLLEQGHVVLRPGQVTAAAKRLEQEK